MREICTSGSVGGLGGATTQAYPAGGAALGVPRAFDPERFARVVTAIVPEPIE